MTEPGRFVVLGLARARAPWFRAVAHWANSAAIPVDFSKCVSLADLRARLERGGPLSAVLIDAGIPGLDRDSIDAAARASAAVIVVDDVRVHVDWTALGATAVINALFERNDLIDILERTARRVSVSDRPLIQSDQPPESSDRANLIAVCGPGGTGASTAAIALAQGLARSTDVTSVLLADLARRAEQSMLHDARDVAPGIQELVEAHRTSYPSPHQVRELTFFVADRGYDLLLGLRRPHHWPVVKPRAFEAALEALLRTWSVIICDVDGDLEGEGHAGSLDVEERNVMARTTCLHADAVFAVGGAGAKGTFSLVRTIHELLEHGVEPGRVVPVVNRAPKSARARADAAAALASLVTPRMTALAVAGPVFIPERPVEEAIRDCVPLPDAVVAPLVMAFQLVTDRHTPRRSVPEIVPVTPGSLGLAGADG